MLYQAVREGLASGEVRVPKSVLRELGQYLRCGRLCEGFVQVRCPECRAVTVVAFSCKGRGLCPSCTTRRSVETGAALAEWLPAVGWRQWTVSLPMRLRWAAVKTRGFLPQVAREVTRAVWRWQRSTARRLGETGPLEGGAVSFLQLFGGRLQLTRHFHVVMPEALWKADGTCVELPPPDTADVEAVLRRLLVRLAKSLAALEEASGDADDEDEVALRVEQARAAQRVLVALEPRTPGRRRRVAAAQGFSLHADTWVHAHNREGLEMLCRYGSRGPVAESRVRRLDDGRYEYLGKRGTSVVLTAAALLRRLVALVPRKGLHLTRYHGVFAPNAALRGAVVLPSAQEEAADAEELEALAAPASGSAPLRLDALEPRGAESAPGCSRGGCPQARGTRATAAAEPTSVSRSWGSEETRPDSVGRRRPRLDWATLQRRTFGEDVFRCPCGGNRAVLALVTRRGTAREVLRNLGMLEPDEDWGACATGPPRRPGLGLSTPARRQLVLELDGATA